MRPLRPGHRLCPEATVPQPMKTSANVPMNSATGGLSCRTRVVFNVGPSCLLRHEVGD